MASKEVDITREGKDLRLVITVSDVTTSRLSRAFQVEPGSLYLKQEFGDRSYWPNDGGKFNLVHVPEGCSLLVMGEDQQCEGGVAGSTSFGPAQAQSVLPYSPATVTQLSASNPLPLFSKAPWGKKSNFSCKVIHASMNKNDRGAPQFKVLKQTYITLNEQCANMPSITTLARERFGDDVVLVAGNGLPIEDETGTRGASFWRCASRKIYAVPRGQVTKNAAKRSVTHILSDDSELSDEPEFTKKSKRSKRSLYPAELKADISDIKSLLTDIFHINTNLAIPISVLNVVENSFKCSICLKSPMVPPIVASRCCNSLLGCSACVTTWFEGDGGLEKGCPKCREARGYAHTVHFKGLDEFLSGFAKVLKSADDD